MVRRLKRIYEMAEGIGAFDWRFRMPKLITFALPSVETTDHDCEKEVLKLQKLLPAARAMLTSQGVLGGTYVLECTTRLIWSDLVTEEQRRIVTGKQMAERT